MFESSYIFLIFSHVEVHHHDDDEARSAASSSSLTAALFINMTALLLFGAMKFG
jgi:hypothetical protein